MLMCLDDLEGTSLILCFWSANSFQPLGVSGAKAKSTIIVRRDKWLLFVCKLAVSMI